MKPILVTLIAIVLSLPGPVAGLDGVQWQQLIPDWKVMYVTGVVESWMHEVSLVDLLKRKAPETSSTLENTFRTFLPCLKERNASAARLVSEVDSYVEEHPNQREQSMAGIVWTAVYEFCR